PTPRQGRRACIGFVMRAAHQQVPRMAAADVFDVFYAPLAVPCAHRAGSNEATDYSKNRPGTPTAMASLERFALAPDLIVCRILNGMWQVTGGHGRIDREQVLGSMAAHVDAGFTTWDLADHYGPAEDLVGEFRRRYPAERGE